MTRAPVTAVLYVCVGVGAPVSGVTTPASFGLVVRAGRTFGVDFAFGITMADFAFETTLTPSVGAGEDTASVSVALAGSCFRSPVALGRGARVAVDGRPVMI